VVAIKTTLAMQQPSKATMEPIRPTPADQLEAEYRLIKVAAKDPAQFAPLYNRYYRSMLQFIYRRVNTKEEAFDVTQQVFIKAMLSLDSFTFQGLPFSSWLYRVAINEMNQLFRKEKAQRALNIDTDEIAELKEETYYGRDDDEALFKALEVLQEDDLHLVEMRFFEKRPFAEIGEILNITENNAKVKLYRVLDKLKALMA
jgi:RNA polymerase sigma-70 factor (ECF subfamily)